MLEMFSLENEIIECKWSELVRGAVNGVKSVGAGLSSANRPEANMVYKTGDVSASNGEVGSSD